MSRTRFALGFLAATATPAWAQTGDGSASTGLIVFLLVALVFFLGIRPYIASAVELGLRRFFKSEDGQRVLDALRAERIDERG